MADPIGRAKASDICLRVIAVALREKPPQMGR
jgi:hypothetical protein